MFHNYWQDNQIYYSCKKFENMNKLNQDMQPYAENKSGNQRLQFQKPKIIDISSIYGVDIDVEFFLSPYNSFLLIWVVNAFWKLFEYKNGALINYQNYDNINDEFGVLTDFNSCLFMKNTNEFIVWENGEIKFCRIEQNQQWKTIQFIQNIPVSWVALSTDEQTFFVCHTNLSLYKKCQQKTRNQIWACFLQVPLTEKYPIDRFFNDQACNTFIASVLNTAWIHAEKDAFWIVKNYKNLKIRKLLKGQSKHRPLGLCEDKFIVFQKLIIQWNKWSRKILRKYKPKIGNQKITLISYNQESKFNLAYKNKQQIFWEFQNGKIRTLQILKDQFYSDRSQIGNNGQLLMKCSYMTCHPIVFYEQTQ